VTFAVTSRSSWFPRSSRQVRESRLPSREAASALSTEPSTSRPTAAAEGRSTNRLAPWRTTTLRLSGSSSVARTLSRARWTDMPPTSTPLIRTPLAIVSRLPWSNA
jgi:hypothetical protein